METRLSEMSEMFKCYSFDKNFIESTFFAKNCNECFEGYKDKISHPEGSKILEKIRSHFVWMVLSSPGVCLRLPSILSPDIFY